MSVKIRFVRAVALLSSGLLLGGFAPAANAYGNAFACTSSVYTVVGGQLTLGSVNNQPTPSQITYSNLGAAYSESYNAAGYNAIDNYVYAIGVTTQDLLRIAADGSVRDLGKPAAFSALAPGVGFKAGDVLPDGSALIAITDDHQVFSINVDTVVATKIGTIGNFGTTTNQINLGDIAILKAGNTVTAYGLDTTSGNLVSFDPTVSNITVNSKVLGAPIAAGKAKSAIWADSAGDLSALIEQSGSGSVYGVYRPSADAVVAQLATGPAVANFNGIKCANSPSAFKNPLPKAPGAPGTPTGTGGPTNVTLNFTPPTTGDAVTSYSVAVTPNAGSCVVDAVALTAVCSGLTNGTSYTFTVTATNSGGSATSASSAAVIPVADPDVLPPDGDGSTPPMGITGKGPKVFIASNDPTFQLAWDKVNGVLISRATGVYTGYIEAKMTFKSGGTTYSCSTVYGQLKVIKIDKLTKTNAKKVAAEKKAAVAPKVFPGKQFCNIDKTKLDPATTSPVGGMTPANFKKIKPISKTPAELTQEAAAAAALKNFSGRVDFQIIRYRAWPTTMVNLGDFTSKGGKIAIQIRNTSVNLN